MKPSQSGPNGRTLLERGLLPVEELAALAEREARRPRPIYEAHRWFARRFGSAFRALLIGASSQETTDFWTAYYGGVDMTGWSVLDPFVGGGTSVVEAQRLGANVTGIDIDPVACAITRFETHAASTPDLDAHLQRLIQEIGQPLERFYRTETPDGPRTVVHFFWVQRVTCRECGAVDEAHPHYCLAWEAEGTRQWVFCPDCYTIVDRNRGAKTFRCPCCNRRVTTSPGTVQRGVFTCRACGSSERLIDYARRTKRMPTWHMFALETLEAPFERHPVPLAQRQFRTATDQDRKIFQNAARALRRSVEDAGTILGVPNTRIPRANRTDNRLIHYQYERYSDLFNPRQLLHLGRLSRAISKLPDDVRVPLALGFSNHLTTNCMLTSYAFGWRRLAPLFAIRSFRHVTRPVELNPWLAGTGRGTFPNKIRQLCRAISFAEHPREPLREGGFQQIESRAPSTPPVILNADARRLEEVEDETVDLVLTDPPYFDNIAYSELSDFFRPWLEQLASLPRETRPSRVRARSLAAKDRDDNAAADYGSGLSKSLNEMARVLKPEGRLVFTYQHRSYEAWWALAQALAQSSFRPLQLLPLLGDGTVSLHLQEGTSTWDAVFVLAKHPKRPGLSLDEQMVRQVQEHCFTWETRLKTTGKFRTADRLNFLRASLVAAALGLFGEVTSPAVELYTLLKQPAGVLV